MYQKIYNYYKIYYIIYIKKNYTIKTYIKDLINLIKYIKVIKNQYY